MFQKKIYRGLIAVAVPVALAGAYAHFGPHNLASAQTAIAAPANSSVLPAPQAASIAAPTDFSGIVDRFGPAVVNISVTGKAQRTPAALALPDLSPGDPFGDFFRRFGPQFPGGAPEARIIRGQGSGFVVSADGLILTNAHVVDGAQEVTVKLTDRREFKAKVLGSDKETDVAVLKIEAANLPTVKFGNPAAAKVGEPVLAIGSPFGFENTATSGIISAKSRSLSNDTYVPFIQTDVAVNPGNSGGPLFNLKGEVIGINSQIYSKSGGFQGLSFAIPIDVATRVEEQLVHSGKVTRGRLGVSIQELNQALADSFGLKKLQGALVSSVERDSPAEKAGLKAGDVIVRLNGKDVNQSTDLPAQVSAMKPGTQAKLDIIREGADKTIEVKIGEMKSTAVALDQDGAAEHAGLGVAVRPLAKDEQSRAGVSGGLAVENVRGAAAEAGIQQGDIIVSANGTAVTSVEQLQKLVRKAGKTVALLVQRDKDRIFVPVHIG